MRPGGSLRLLRGRCGHPGQLKTPWRACGHAGTRHALSRPAWKLENAPLTEDCGRRQTYVRAEERANRLYDGWLAQKQRDEPFAALDTDNKRFLVAPALSGEDIWNKHPALASWIQARAALYEAPPWFMGRGGAAHAPFMHE
jgi:hypothetical protein